jgi:hypothetical protein
MPNVDERSAIMPRVHPQITKYAHEISPRTKYPIRNFAQLMKAFGGEDAVIELEGPRGHAKELRRAIPDEFFPVESEQDLREQSEALRAKYLDKSPV